LRLSLVVFGVHHEQALNVTCVGKGECSAFPFAPLCSGSQILRKAISISDTAWQTVKSGCGLLSVHTLASPLGDRQTAASNAIPPYSFRLGRVAAAPAKNRTRSPKCSEGFFPSKRPIKTIRDCHREIIVTVTRR
jgi:hypothetical protein